jgi:phospholipase/carboxylesterase
MLDLPDYQLIFPDAPWPHPYGPGGKIWYGFPQNFQFQSDLGDRPDLQASRQQLQTWLSNLSETTGLPLERIILGGFSQGGAMALDVGLSLPLAGLMVLSGYLHQSLQQDPPPPAPILMLHGQVDPVVPIQAARQARDSLLEIGANLHYTEIPAMGHEVSLPVLERMQAFVQNHLG